ncbi:hypothetical protein [uncultured Methylophaga sp.]|uniref:hypothetical protein n=1 Tax=uncultured Methylophaga sp. TaxID=285271 RepID=UPI0026084A1B|nr:hypothetical protein [uncultured Methylophaga sp.]
MAIREIFEIGGAVLLSLGGAGAIIFGLSSWLGKVWAARILAEEKAKYGQDLEAFKSALSNEAERHRVRLKKSEFIFEKEFEAASKLVYLVRDINPQMTHPEMDWFDACDDIALSFSKIESQLHDFMKSHGAVLPDGVKHLLSLCHGISAENKFEVDSKGPTTKANNAAEVLFGHLKQAEFEFLGMVHGQVST